MQRFRKSRYRKQAKTIPLRATDGDSGREEIDKGNLYRCWNCGFICDIRRDELAKDGRRGTTLSVSTARVTLDYDVTFSGYAAFIADGTFVADGNILAGAIPPTPFKETNVYNFGSARTRLSTGVGQDIVLMQDNKTIRHYFTVSGTGCPLCHTRNYKKH